MQRAGGVIPSAVQGWAAVLHGMSQQGFSGGGGIWEGTKKKAHQEHIAPRAKGESVPGGVNSCGLYLNKTQSLRGFGGVLHGRSCEISGTDNIKVAGVSCLSHSSQECPAPAPCALCPVPCALCPWVSRHAHRLGTG